MSAPSVARSSIGHPVSVPSAVASFVSHGHPASAPSAVARFVSHGHPIRRTSNVSLPQSRIPTPTIVSRLKSIRFLAPTTWTSAQEMVNAVQNLKTLVTMGRRPRPPRRQNGHHRPQRCHGPGSQEETNGRCSDDAICFWKATATKATSEHTVRRFI